MITIARRFRRLGQLGAERRGAVLRALPTAVAVEVGLRCLALPRLASLLGVPIDTTPARETRSTRALPPRGLDAYTYAADVVYRRQAGRCLRRCLLVGYLLRRERPRLRLGVRRAAGTVEAHAWLELDGVPLDLEVPTPSPASGFTPLRHAGSRSD